jgi:pimeloyl-ACP methyl ester carboxylesterase
MSISLYELSMNLNPVRSKITKLRLMVGVAGIAVIAILYVAICWYLVGQALEADVVGFESRPQELGLAYEDVEFHPRGDESITLRGWWLPAEDSKGSVIWVHGLGKNRADQLPLLRDLISNGFSILAFDLRGHGQSDLAPFGAGTKGPADVRGAIDFLITDKASSDVILMGHSFGGSIVLLAGAGEVAVVGVYADSAFAALTDVMIDGIEVPVPFLGWLPSLLRPGIVLVAGIRGVELGAVRPEIAMKDYTGMVFGIVHCIDDESVLMEHAFRIRKVVEANAPWFNLFPRCGHAEAYESLPETYVAIVTGYFLEQFGHAEAKP